MIELPVPVSWAAGTGASLSEETGVESAKREPSSGWAMAGIESAIEAARQYIMMRNPVA